MQIATNACGFLSTALQLNFDFSCFHLRLANTVMRQIFENFEIYSELNPGVKYCRFGGRNLREAKWFDI